MTNDHNQAAERAAQDVMQAIKDARDIAMKNVVTARIPECGDFGDIAQNLDWAIHEMERRSPAVGEDGQLDKLDNAGSGLANSAIQVGGEDGLPPRPAPGIAAYAIVGKDGAYTAEQVRQAQREAVAAHKRKHAALQEMVDIAQANDMGYGPSVSASHGVKTWQERTSQYETEVFSQIERMEAEIVDLRAQLALRGQGEPVAWARRWHVDGETPAKVKGENGRWAWPQKFKFHAVTPNKVFKDDAPLYAAPALPTAPQADFRALVKSIMADGYLSETNVHRARLALDGMASAAPAEQKGDE